MMNLLETTNREASIEVARQIGYFYLDKNGGDLPKATKELESLRISKIELTDATITIHLGRPGLIIGRKGANFEALEKHLGKKISIYEAEHWLDYLIPYVYCEEEL